MDFSPKWSASHHRELPGPFADPDVGANGSGDPLDGRESEPLDSTATKFPVLPGKAPAGTQPEGPSEIVQEPLWWRRTKLVIFVAFCVELGMILIVLPWTRLWTDNNLLLAYPGLRSLLRQNFVRGLLSGIGLIDVWMGIWEAARYKEAKP